MKVFILHGWAVDPHNAAKWQRFCAVLKTAGIQTEVLETPGLTTPLNEVWQLQDFVDWLGGKLAGEKRVFLLGHSFGGQIAIRFAAQHPEKVSELILIDSAGIRAFSLKAKVKRAVFFAAAKIGKMFFRGESFRRLLYKLAQEKDYFSASPLLRKTMANVIETEVLEDLTKIQAKSLVIWGRNDTVTPLSHGEIFAEKIPNSTLKIIDNARHSPQFTHTDEVAKIVSAFVQK
jgi:pimeloyl-ACP methyl ester carboxylesterase